MSLASTSQLTPLSVAALLGKLLRLSSPPSAVSHHIPAAGRIVEQ